MDDRKIEEYRQPWESEDHWKLRKEFIQKYQDQFPEYTLIALSQVHSDTELHGKRFPVPVILPNSEECQKITDDNQKDSFKVLNENKQDDADLFPEEEPENAEILGEEGEEKYEDPEMFVEVVEEDHDDPEMFSETSHWRSIQESSESDLQWREMGDGRVWNHSPQNVDCAGLESCEKDIQFDVLSESTNDESGEQSYTQSDMHQSDSSLESSSGELPESLKENLVSVFQFVRKLHAEKLNALQVLDKLSKNFNVKVECLSEQLRKAKCIHLCSVMVDGVSISMGKAPTKKSARRQAVNLAVARLMNINWLLVKANFSFSKLSEIVCATKQSSSQSTTVEESSGMSLENPSVQEAEFNTIPEKSENDWNSSQDIILASDNNPFESSSGQNEPQYDFYGSLQGETEQNCMMQSSYVRSEESSEKVIQGMLPNSFKSNFMDVFQFIKKLHDEKINGLQILEKVAKTFNARVEFNSAVFNHAKSVHHCSVEIDGVLISRGKGSTKKNARRDAGKLAIDRLMQLLTRAKLSFSYRSKLSSSADMNSFAMLGNSSAFDTMLRDVSTSNVMFENYSCQNKFDGGNSSSDSAMQNLESVNSYALDTLPTHLKAKFKQVSQFVRKSLAQNVNPVSILNNMAQKYKLPVKFKVKEHHFLSHECFLYIDTKLFTKAEALSEREARLDAAKSAINRLMEISDKVRNVNSSKGEASVSAGIASSNLGASSFGSISYPSDKSATCNSVVNAYKNSMWLLNVIKYNCEVGPEITPFAARNSGLTSVSQNGSFRQNANSVNIFNEMFQNAERRSDNGNLGRFMVDYPHQNMSVRSCYPAPFGEPSCTRPDLVSSAKRGDMPPMADRYDLAGKRDQPLREEGFGLPNRTERLDVPNNRAERFDLPNRTERFDLPNRTERFDLPNRTERFDLTNTRMERLDMPNNRTERFDLPNRTERFDLPNRTERFDLTSTGMERLEVPNNRMERFDLPNRTERFDLPNRTERFDLPNRIERFDLPNSRMDRFSIPNNTTERFDMPNRAERFELPHKAEHYNLPVKRHLPTPFSSHQSRVKDEGPKVWLHEL